MWNIQFEILGMVVHTCNPSCLRRLRQEILEFQVSLDYIVRPCLTKRSEKENMV
jgi:hypothetical protein